MDPRRPAGAPTALPGNRSEVGPSASTTGERLIVRNVRFAEPPSSPDVRRHTGTDTLPISSRATLSNTKGVPSRRTRLGVAGGPSTLTPVPSGRSNNPAHPRTNARFVCGLTAPG